MFFSDIGMHKEVYKNLWLFLPCKLLRLCLLLTFQLLDIGRRLEILRSDSTFHQKFSDSLIIFCMFESDSALSLHRCIFSEIMIRHFCGEVFCLEEYGGEEVCERTLFADTEFMLHLFRSIPTEECRISLTSYTCHPHTIDTTFEGNTSELFFCLSELFSYVDPLEVEEFFLYEFLFACLDSEVRLSKGDLLFARIAILCDEVCRIACEMKVYTWSSSCTFYRRR